MRTCLLIYLSSSDELIKDVKSQGKQVQVTELTIFFLARAINTSTMGCAAIICALSWAREETWSISTIHKTLASESKLTNTFPGPRHFHWSFQRKAQISHHPVYSSHTVMSDRKHAQINDPQGAAPMEPHEPLRLFILISNMQVTTFGGRKMN